MKSNLFLQVITLLFCIVFSSSVKAETIGVAEAQSWVENRGHQLLATFAEPDIIKKYTTLDTMFVDFIDLDYVSKFVIGKYWRQMTAEQQNTYQELFKRYALNIYKGFPLNFDAKAIKFEVIKVQNEKKNTSVKTKVSINNQNINQQAPISDIIVDFKLDKKNNQIKIIDLKLGESSLILSYRSRFYEMIANSDDDITWFLEDLADITDAAERTNQQKLKQYEY